MVVLILWSIAKYILGFVEEGFEKYLGLEGIFKGEDLREMLGKYIFCGLIEKKVYVRDKLVEKFVSMEHESDLREKRVMRNDYLVNDQLGLIGLLTGKFAKRTID